MIFFGEAESHSINCCTIPILIVNSQNLISMKYMEFQVWMQSHLIFLPGPADFFQLIPSPEKGTLPSPDDFFKPSLSSSLGEGAYPSSSSSPAIFNVNCLIAS